MAVPGQVSLSRDRIKLTRPCAASEAAAPVSPLGARYRIDEGRMPISLRYLATVRRATQ